MKSAAKLQVVNKKAQWDENLRLWLEKFMKDNPEIKPAELARQIGVSRTMLIDYVNCKYLGVMDPKTGNIRTTENSKIERTLRAYRARVDGPNSESNGEFVKTT